MIFNWAHARMKTNFPKQYNSLPDVFIWRFVFREFLDGDRFKVGRIGPRISQLDDLVRRFVDFESGQPVDVVRAQTGLSAS